MNSTGPGTTDWADVTALYADIDKTLDDFASGNNTKDESPVSSLEDSPDDTTTASQTQTLPSLRHYRHPVVHDQQPAPRTIEAEPAPDPGPGNMVRPTITWDWDRDHSSHYWSDAETARTVLTLLHKDPISPPPSVGADDETHPPQSVLSTCAACFQRLDQRSYPASYISARCDHASIPEMQICLPCLRRSLSIQLSSRNTDGNPLACPLCRAPLSDDEVQRWASRDTFQLYDTIRTRTILESDSDFVNCVREDCRFGQFHAGGREYPIVVCGACGTRTCFIHRDAVWHEGLSCEEYGAIADRPSDH